MFIDGRAIRDELQTQLATRVAKLPVPPHLSIIACQPTLETKTFIAKKTAMAEAIGVTVTRYDVPADSTLESLSELVTECVQNSDGIIMQLPFPHLSSDSLLALIPSSHDVDVSRYDGTDKYVLPPVIGAIHEISERHDLVWSGKTVAIVGYGRLVGKPAAVYATMRGANLKVLTIDSPNKADILKTADIIILGAGATGLLTASMVKEGVVVFDAGTSEEAGVLRGDADQNVALKASLFTPVPGGIGPITVAVLLQNLVLLRKRRK